ncbi:MAG: B12-binding domain-containing radical SAM protein [Bacteroidia bacterium]|nr:B12-binding domain-containing radical SAM protein [Bacteroidia bacterium]
MKHTVILYNPDAVFYTMPLALLAIGSYLDAEKYNVVIVDGRLEKDPMRKINEALKQNPVCFATTVLTGGPIKDALKISRAVKKQMSSLPVVWGGWHPSLFPEHTLDEPCIDVVVKGQGEITFKELLERFVNNTALDGLKGISFKKNNTVIENPERIMEDINTFPAFNYDLIDVPGYIKLSGRKQLDYISSQGCRFRCSFCADPFMYKRGWYGYSPERMGNEIESLWKKYKFNHVHFQDETFFTYAPRVKAIAEEFIKRKLPISWFGTMRADQGVRLSDDIWKLCKESGLERVMIGMDAGTQEMLDWMQKDIKLEQIYEVAKLCLKHKIAINFSVIVGFPGETVESITKTLDVVKELRKMSSTFHMGIFFYKPYPGNKIADELLAKGYQFNSTLEEWSNFDYVDSGKSEWMSDETINMVENFKFYQNLAYNKPSLAKFFFRQVAKWRVENKAYRFPVEKKLKEWLQPQQRMA